MKPGKSQNDIVSGEARLSSILRAVRAVGKPQFVKRFGRLVRAEALAVLDHPESALESAPICASIRAVNCERPSMKNRPTSRSTRSLRGDFLAVDDDLAAGAIALAQPKPAVRQAGRISGLAQDAVLQLLVAGLHRRGDRVEQRDGDDPDQQRHQDGRRQETPKPKRRRRGRRPVRCCGSAARTRASSRTGSRTASHPARCAAASGPPSPAARPRWPAPASRRAASARYSRAGR